MNTDMPLGGGRKLENPEETTDTGRACIETLHRQKPQKHNIKRHPKLASFHGHNLHMKKSY